jgi:hypothetical protein
MSASSTSALGLRLLVGLQNQLKPDGVTLCSRRKISRSWT